ncbi:hypothetical protein [Povalibacter sp.]|uniref:hypothetical protein n=1 Tax=Povalibacter sp. TaxID=1962978 RepID=UPI002F3F9152
MRSVTEAPRGVAIVCAFVVGCSLSTNLADSRLAVRLLSMDALRPADPAKVLPEWAWCAPGDACFEVDANALQLPDAGQMIRQRQPDSPDLALCRASISGGFELPGATCAENRIVDTRI